VAAKTAMLLKEGILRIRIFKVMNVVSPEGKKKEIKEWKQRRLAV
jgi:hypothetical protein